jgi:hypothetical protein
VLHYIRPEPSNRNHYFSAIRALRRPFRVAAFFHYSTIPVVIMAHLMFASVPSVYPDGDHHAKT